MSFRLNPFKVMRAVGIVAIIAYGVVLATGYKKSKVTTTESVTKEMKVRNKDFYNSKDYKNNLTLPNQVIENNNETVAKELEQTKSAETVDLQNPTVNNQQTQPQNNPKAAKEDKKKEEQKKLEAQKLEQKKLAEQRRQEEERAEARHAEIKKQQQEAAARKEQAAAQARAEAARQRAKEEATRKAKEEATKKAREDAKNRQAKGHKKYIQVASVASEASAREITKKLGGNFYYKKTSVNGRTVYVVMSNMTDNPNTLKTMENQAKKAGSGYMIRSTN